MTKKLSSCPELIPASVSMIWVFRLCVLHANLLYLLDFRMASVTALVGLQRNGFPYAYHCLWKARGFQWG
jgi:hypothetical protein